MTLTPELLASILNFAVKFGLDAAIAIAGAKPATIDDAIAALGAAKDKSIEQYIAEDAAVAAVAATQAGPV